MTSKKHDRNKVVNGSYSLRKALDVIFKAIKVCFYILPSYLTVAFASRWAEANISSTASMYVFWIGLLYLFAGIDYSLRSVPRDKLLHQPFSLNVLYQIYKTSFLWAYLKGFKK